MILLVLLGGCGAAAAHDVYLGFGEARLDSGRVTGRLAYNKLDLLQALQAEAQQPLYELEPQGLDALTLRYLRRHFRVWADGDSAAVQLDGQGQQDDAVILQFSCPVPLPVDSLRIRNDVLFDLFPDQVNTLRLRHGEREHRLVFRPDEPERVVGR